MMVTRPPEPRSGSPDQGRMRSGRPRSPPRRLISGAYSVVAMAADVHSQREPVHRWALATASTTGNWVRVFIAFTAPTTIAPR